MLTSALAFVLLRHLLDPELVAADVGAATGASAESAVTRPVPSVTQPISRMASWPDLALPATLAHNPSASLVFASSGETEDISPHPVANTTRVTTFRSEKESPEDHEAAKQESLAEFQRLGVTRILKHKSKTCAVDGGQVVHEGDIINGVRIV